MAIVLIHPKGIKKHSRPAILVRFGNTSADDLTVFVLDFEDEFLFVRVNLMRHDLIYLFADVDGLFFCQVSILKSKCLFLKLRITYLLVINVTVSTWKVWGKRSTGVMLLGIKTPDSSKRAMSRASVAGSQLT